MNKKVIAVDLDDVLSDTVPKFLEFSNKQWGMHLTIDDYDEHLARMWKVEDHEAEKRIMEYHESGVSENYKHDEVAVGVLRKLSKKYELVITTSRRRQLEPMTRAWLEKHYNGIFSDVKFAGIWDSDDRANRMNMTKAALCQEINASFLIDDQPKHCKAAAEVGIEALLFGLYPWNKDVKLGKSITRTESWLEVEEFFNGRG